MLAITSSHSGEHTLRPPLETGLPQLRQRVSKSRRSQRKTVMSSPVDWDLAHSIAGKSKRP